MLKVTVNILFSNSRLCSFRNLIVQHQRYDRCLIRVSTYMQVVIIMKLCAVHGMKAMHAFVFSECIFVAVQVATHDTRL